MTCWHIPRTRERRAMKLNGTIAALALMAMTTSCASVTINGHEVTQDSQIVTAFGMIAAGAIVYSIAEEDGAPEAKDQQSPGTVICKVNPDTMACD